MIKNLVLIIWIFSNIIIWLYPSNFLLVAYAIFFIVTIRFYNVEEKSSTLPDYILFYTIILPPFTLNIALYKEYWLFIAFTLLLVAVLIIKKFLHHVAHHRMNK
jgi:hypothetical protein